MTFQPVPDTIQVNFHMQDTEHSIQIQSSMYFRNEGGWNEAQITAVADVAGDTWGSAVMPNLNSDNWNFYKVTARDIGDQFGVMYEDMCNVGGGVSGGMAPPQIACGVTFKGNVAGPPRQGRIFVGGLALPSLTETGINSTVADAIKVDVQAVATAAEAAELGTEHVIVSRYETIDGVKTPRDPALTKVVTVYIAEYKQWSQRDRRPGEGS